MVIFGSIASVVSIATIAAIATVATVAAMASVVAIAAVAFMVSIAAVATVASVVSIAAVVDIIVLICHSNRTKINPPTRYTVLIHRHLHVTYDEPWSLYWQSCNPNVLKTVIYIH